MRGGGGDALFCVRPNFRAAKQQKMPRTCGKPYGNACYAGYPETVKTFKMTNWHILTAIWQKLTGAQSRVSTKATTENETSFSLAVINTIQCLTRL